MEDETGGRHGLGILLCAAFLLMLAWPIRAAGGAAIPASSIELSFSVGDAEGHAVPDALVIVNYQSDAKNPQVDAVREEYSDVAGKVRATLRFGENTSAPNYIYASVYTPFWSSGRTTLRVPPTTLKEVSANFTVPLKFDTFRVTVRSANRGLPGAVVRIFEPMLTAKKTDSGGTVQFRFPRGANARGEVEYIGQAQAFRMDGTEGGPGQVLVQNVQVPFSNPRMLKVGPTYNFSIQMFDASGTVLAGRQVGIGTGGFESAYYTDSNGIIHMHDVPFDTLNLTWEVRNITYNYTVDCKNPPQKVNTPVLLRILPPDVSSLGEACYRITVNITDPRADAIEQVVAKTKDSREKLPFVMESSHANGSSINFQRIICVVEDTQFYITAANQYEETSMQIQLLKNNKRPDATPPVAFVIDKVPKADTSRIDNAQRIELVVLLVELLVFLIFIYIMLRFRAVVMYYFQAVLRFAYFLYQDISRTLRKKKYEDKPPEPPMAS